MDLILIKYGELTTKKGNRKTFIKRLENNIKKQLIDIHYTIRSDYSRMYIETDKAQEIVEKLNKVFGIHGIVLCEKVKVENELVKEKALEQINKKNIKTFKVVTKRSDKNFPIDSMEYNNLIGGYILRNTNLKVDVHNPDLFLNIENIYIKLDYVC